MGTWPEDGANGDQAEAEPRVLGKKVSDLLLCFLSCPLDAGRNYLGAALTTDARGRPLEFSFVEPVRPTRLQAILYGRTLEEHVRIDVITAKLLQGTTKRPDVIFVDSANLLAARRIAGAPVARLFRAEADDVTCSKLSTLNYDVGEHKDDEQVIGQLLGHLEPLVDLVEPFERVAEGLKEALKSLAERRNQ